MSGIGRLAAKIGKLSSIYLAGSIIPPAIGLFLLPVFTHYLLPEQLGIVRLAGQLVAPTAIAIQLGLWSALKSLYFRTDAAQRGELVRAVVAGQVGQATLICLALSAAGLSIAPYVLPNLPLTETLVFYLWVLVVWQCLAESLCRLATGVSQLEERAVTSVSVTLLKYLVQSGFGVFAVVVLAWEGFGRQVTIFAGTAVAAAWSAVVLWRAGRGALVPRLYLKAVRLGVTFVPHAVSGLLNLTVNSWLLAKLVSTAALGVYSVAVQFVLLLQLPMSAVNNAAYPTLAKLMADGSDDARSKQTRLYTLLLAGITTLALGLFLFAPIAIHALAAPAYHQAKQIVQLLVVAWLFQGYYLVVSQRIFYLGGGLWLAAGTVSSLVATLILGLLLIPIYGVWGAALSMLGCFVTRFAVAWVVGQLLYPLPWQRARLAFFLAGIVALGTIDVAAAPFAAWWVGLILKAALFAGIVPLARAVASTAELQRVWQSVLGRIGGKR